MKPARMVSVVVVVVLVILVARPVLSAADELLPNYYDLSCPDFEKIVNTKVTKRINSDSSLAPSLLRLLFNDCIVTGCDASVLLDYEGTERRSPASKTLRGFKLIEDIKSEIENSCPGLVSCADILIAASRDATVLLGGPSWANVYGRRDSENSNAKDAEEIADPNVTGLIETFQSNGLDILDLVVLSGAHTIGKSTCGTVQSRLYNFNGTGGSDPSLNRKYADFLRRKCRWASETVNLDAVTPAKFDNQYYINLQKNMGLLSTDQELAEDTRTAPLVASFARQPTRMFREQFAVSMAKLVNVGVITGEDRGGEIRKVCSKSNSRP